MECLCWLQLFFLRKKLQEQVALLGLRPVVKLDLSLWWYYLPVAAAMAVCYGDVLLPMLGVQLPLSETVASFGFYALYLLASFAVHYFLRNRAEVAYALAYDAVKPAESQESGVVLGNIFQM